MLLLPLVLILLKLPALRLIVLLPLRPVRSIVSVPPASQRVRMVSLANQVAAS